MFEKIIGNNEIKSILNNSIKSGNVSHSYLFVGKSGIGKKLFATELAKKVMCLGTDNCESCIKFDANSNPDFTMIVPDGKTIKIEQIRNMQKKIIEKPITSKKKVYIIDNAECMSEESQNCLLKTLEEPPEYAMIILICSNESRMLQTIKSRCVIIRFENLTDEEISKAIGIQDKDIIKLCGGSLENIDKIQDKKNVYNTLKQLVELIENGNMVQVFNNADVLYSAKEDISYLLDFLNIIYFEKCKTNINCSKAINIIEKTKKKIIANNNINMSIDYMLMHIREECYGKSSRC